MHNTNRKIRILFYGDSPTCATGFATVSRNILLGLYKTGKYDIDIFGINYWGDPKPPLTQIFNIFPAGMNNERDPYGREKFKAFAMQAEFDILFFLQDSFILTFIKDLIPALKARGKKFVSICYYPCDSVIKPEWADAVCSVDYPVAYSQFAKQQTNRPDKDIQVIYHGVELKEFYPLPQDEVSKFRNQYFSKRSKSWITCNVNRNQQRKDIPRYLMGVKAIKKLGIDITGYCHMAQRDQGWDLAEVCKTLGLDSSKDVLFPVNFSPNQGYPIHVLNAIYNASDCVVSTDLGEGFGLCLDKDTSIYTEKGCVRLKHINVDDKVLSSDGAYHRVEAIMTKHHIGLMYEIHVDLGGDPIKASPQHGFMVKEFTASSVVWKPASELQEGDTLVCPVSGIRTALYDRIKLSEIILIDSNFIYTRITEITKYAVDDVLIDIQVADINDFVAECVVVHNSQVEALATRTPIIMPNNTVRRELLNDDIAYLVDSGTGSNLWTVLPHDNEVLRPLVDVEDLAKKMKYVYENPEEAKEKASAGYAFVKNNLAWDTCIIPKWLKLFEKAVSKLNTVPSFKKAATTIEV